MKFLLSILTSFLFTLPSLSQVRPDQFPEKTNPESTDEIYSQTGGTSVRITFGNSRKYFAAQIIGQTSPPSSTGNPESIRNKFVQVSSDGSFWFVDQFGIGVKVQSPGSTIYEINFLSDTTTIIAPRQGDVAFVDSTLFAFRGPTKWLAFQGGDDWGNQVVGSDITLLGDGLGLTPLKVDTTDVIPTKWLVDSLVQDLMDSLDAFTPWVISGNDIHYTGEVGINNSNPTYPLDIGGSNAAIRLNPISTNPAGSAGLFISKTDGYAYHNDGTGFRKLSYLDEAYWLEDGSVLRTILNPTSGPYVTNLAYSVANSDGLSSMSYSRFYSSVNSDLADNTTRMNMYDVAGGITYGYSMESFRNPLDLSRKSFRIFGDNSPSLFWDNFIEFYFLDPNRLTIGNQPNVAEPKMFDFQPGGTNPELYIWGSSNTPGIIFRNTAELLSSIKSESNGQRLSISAVRNNTTEVAKITLERNPTIGEIRFYTGAIGSLAQRMTINQLGFVGVNKISPAYPVDVGGSDASIRLNPVSTNPTGSPGLFISKTDGYAYHHDGSAFRKLAYLDEFPDTLRAYGEIKRTSVSDSVKLTNAHWETVYFGTNGINLNTALADSIITITEPGDYEIKYIIDYGVLDGSGSCANVFFALFDDDTLISGSSHGQGRHSTDGNYRHAIVGETLVSFTGTNEIKVKAQSGCANQNIKVANCNLIVKKIN